MKIDNNSVLIEISDADLVGDGVLVIPEGVVAIKEGCFCSSPILKEIYFPTSLAEIRRSAFRYCMSLRKIVFSKTKNLKIRACAFNTCISLEEVSFEHGLSEIRENAFGNTAIKNINFPKTIKYVGEEAFSRCWALETVHIPSKTQVCNFAFVGSAVKDIYLDGDSKLAPCALYTVSEEKCLIHTNSGKYQVISLPASAFERGSTPRSSKVLIVEDAGFTKEQHTASAFPFKGSFKKSRSDEAFKVTESESGVIVGLNFA